MTRIDWKLYAEFENPYQVIPIPFLRWTYQNRVVNPVATWVMLKMVSKGIFSRPEAFDMVQHMGIYKIDRKTLKTHLDTLKRNLLIRDVGGGVYVLSGYKWVHKSFGFIGKTSVGVFPHDLPNFRQFVAGAIIGYHAEQFAKSETYKKRQGDSGAVKMLDCDTTGIPQFSAGVSVGIIAEQLNVSKGMAHRLKMQCRDLGYLDVQNQFIPVDVGNVSVSADNLPLLREYTNYGFSLKIRQGKYCLQVHDAIKPNMEFRRKSSLKNREKK